MSLLEKKCLTFMVSPIRVSRIWDADRISVDIAGRMFSACRDPAANICCTLRSLVQGSVNWVVRTAVCSIPLLPNCPRGWKRGIKETGRKEVTEAQFNSHGRLQEFFRQLHGNWIKLLVRSHVHKTPDLLFCSTSALDLLNLLGIKIYFTTCGK